MKQTALGLVLLAVLGALGWLAWILVGPGATVDQPVLEAAANDRGAAETPSLAPETAPGAPVERSEAERVAPAIPPPPPSAPMPASYRKALAGVKGRLVEEDGRPIPRLKVELLQIEFGGLFGDFETAFGPEPLATPPLSIGDGVSDEQGVFELQGALNSSFHGIGVDLGGPRGTLRFVDRTLNSGETADLGDVVLSPYVTWSGRVVDEESKPIPGARVRATLFPPIVFQPGVADLGRVACVMHVNRGRIGSPDLIEIPESIRAWESKLPFPTSRSKDDGTFELAGVPQGFASLVADRDGFVGGWKGPTPTGKRDRDVGDVVLARGLTIRGQVVDAAGNPVPAAEIVGGAVIPVADLVIAFPTKADEQGRFALEHLAENAGEFVLAARRTPVDGWCFRDKVDGSAPVTITLEAAVTLDVKLARKGGGAVDGARLWIQQDLDVELLTMVPTREVPVDRVAQIAADHLQVSGLSPGRFRLIGRAPGFAPAFATVELDAEKHETTLEFTPAHELTVRVVTQETNEPIEYAEVSAGADERMSAPYSVRRTDVNGEARFPELPEQTIRLRAFHPAFAAEMRKVDVAALAQGAARVDFQLKPGAALHGYVHQGGRPLAEPILFLLMPTNETLMEGGAIDDQAPRFAVPGLDGTFTITGLAPGDHGWELMPRLFAGDPQQALQGVMEAARVGGTSRRGNVKLEAGKTAELTIDFDPAAAARPGRIVGVIRVTDRDAKFVLRAHTSGRGAVPDDQRSRVFRVAANERFTLEPIAAGFVNVQVCRAGGSEKEDVGPPVHHEFFELAAGEDHELELDLELTAAEVRLVDDQGRPVTDTGVSFQPADGPADKLRLVQSLWAASGEDGVVHIELPRPGRYVVVCQDEKRGRGRAEGDFPSREPLVLALSRGVPCAGRIELDPDPASDRQVWFSVVRVAESSTGESEALNGEPEGWRQFDKGERDFEFVGLAPGRFRAQVFTNDGHASADFALGPNGDDRLVLRFKLR